MQPSFLQRHPLLSGIAGGLAGSWIGHMLFGGTNTEARSGDAGTSDRSTEEEQSQEPLGSMGMLLWLLALGGGMWYYFVKMRQPATLDSSGFARGSVMEPLIDRPVSIGTLSQASSPAVQITPADEATFQELVVEVQTAWSKQDLTALRRLVIPEMLNYFSTALSEDASQEVVNRVQNVSVLSAQIREAWTEEATDYATVSLRWKARDYTVSLVKQHGEPGYIVEGDEEDATESTEAWTYMRHKGGKWLLSAIQQAA